MNAPPDDIRDLDELTEHELAELVYRLPLGEVGSAPSLWGSLVAERSDPSVGASMMARALGLRRPGQSRCAGGDAPPDPARTIKQNVALFLKAVAGVDVDRWHDATELGVSARELVAHLGASYDYVSVQVGALDRPRVPWADETHDGYTGPAVERSRTLSVAQIREESSESLERLVAWAASAPGDAWGRLIDYEGGQAPAVFAVLARAFEAWAHGEHLRRATGQGPAELDAADHYLLCRTAVEALPVALARTGFDSLGRRARIVLTGPGGGTWMATDEIGTLGHLGEPTQTLLVADALGFCQVAGGLTAPSALTRAGTGDEQFLRAVVESLVVYAA